MATSIHLLVWHSAVAPRRGLVLLECSILCKQLNGLNPDRNAKSAKNAGHQAINHICSWIKVRKERRALETKPHVQLG